ncbi:MAG TPA: hypothetical protein VMW31_00930 [Devosiaceae bacterium]|nr:hypothetical protein [Devosiaceae bacterium]
MPAREITQHRLKLEDCIRQVEQEATEALLHPSAPPPEPASAPPESDAEEEAEEAIARALDVEEEEPEPAPQAARPAVEPESRPEAKSEAKSAKGSPPGLISTRKPGPAPAPEPKQEKVAALPELEPEPEPETVAAMPEPEPEPEPPARPEQAAPAKQKTPRKAEPTSIEEVNAAAQEVAENGEDADEAPSRPAPRPVVRPATRIEEPPRHRAPAIDGGKRRPAAAKHTDEDRQAGLEAAINAALSSVREVEVDDERPPPPAAKAPAPPAAAEPDSADDNPQTAAEPDSEDDNPQAAIDRAIAALDREVNGTPNGEAAAFSADDEIAAAPVARPHVPEEPQPGRHEADDDFWSEADAAAFDAANAEFEGEPLLGNEPSGRGGFTIFLTLVVVLLLGAAGGGYWAWREGYVDPGGLMARIGLGGTPAPVSAPVDAGEVVAEAPEPVPADAAAPVNTTQAQADAALPENGAGIDEPGKIDERLPADDAVRVIEPEPQGIGQPAPVAEAAPADAGAPNAEAPAAAAGEAAPDQALLDPALTEGSQSILLEEQGAGASGPAPFSGTVEWSRDVDELGLPVIRARASIPARNLSLDVLIRKNSDEALPASHLMEINFNVLESFVGGGIASLPGVLLKNQELAQGRPLVGASARVFDNSFLFALSAEPIDVTANLTLLREQAWIDLPMVYSTGRRAIITLEKGVEGNEIFGSVLDAWAAQ